MRYRPKRENYATGQFGEIDYQERLERYCTYLENNNKQLRLHSVVSCFTCKFDNNDGKKEPICCHCSGNLDMHEPK